MMQTPIAAHIQELQTSTFDHIPLVRAMDLRFIALHAGRLTANLPLAPNINDKGCAFGGSLVSALTLLGWGLLRSYCIANDIAADIFVQDSEVKYLKAAFTDCMVEAVADEAELQLFLQQLRERGKARMTLKSVCVSAGDVATSMSARYVAITSKKS
jgi:thioesterase domain-containing protein